MLLFNILEDYNVILASQSPRRSELLRGLDINFKVADNFEIEEIYPSDIDKTEVALYLSRLKAGGYPYAVKEKDIIICADTTVLIGDKILGKPKSKEEAQNMLSELCGKSHEVITGVTVRTYDKTDSFKVSTKVVFDNLSPQEIEYYVEKYSPYDKAGSYGIQEWIGYVAIKKIEGSFYNVMGLPIHTLYEYLKNNIKH